MGIIYYERFLITESFRYRNIMRKMVELDITQLIVLSLKSVYKFLEV